MKGIESKIVKLINKENLIGTDNCGIGVYIHLLMRFQR